MTALKKYIYKINTFLKRDAQAEITGVLNIISPETLTIAQVKKKKVEMENTRTQEKEENRWRTRRS